MVVLSTKFAVILALVTASCAIPLNAAGGKREVHDFEGYDAHSAGQTVYYDENDHYARKRGDDDIVTGYKDDTVDTQYHSYDGYKRSVIPAKREVHDFEGYDAKGAGQTVYYDENDHYAKREVHDFEGYDAKGAGQTVYYDENDHYAKRGDDDIVTGYKDDSLDTQYHSYDGYRKRGDDDIVTGYKDDTVDTQYHSYDGYKRAVAPSKREVHDFEGYDAKSAGQTVYYDENDHYARKRGDDDIVTGYKDDTVDTQYHSYDGYKRRSVPSKREVHDFEGYDAKGAGQTVYYDENDHYAKRGDDDIVTGYKDDTLDTQYHSYDGYRKRSPSPHSDRWYCDHARHCHRH